MKVKVDTRIEQETALKVIELSNAAYDGNLSMALRKCIEAGLQVINAKQKSKKS